MEIPSALRLAEHRALEGIELSGRVLDLGGDVRSGYRSLFKGNFEIRTLNLDPKAKPDIVHDLEKPLPIDDASYDHVLLINVLEHVYGYRQLLSETVRVVKPGGSVVIVVPFLFPVHPSPHDYWRFTEETLRKLLDEAGLSDVQVEPLGRGVFTARYLLLDRLLPSSLRLLGFYSFRYAARIIDAAFSVLGSVMGKKYVTSDYALGYCVSGRRPGSRES